jgi:hypothetical protein
VMVKLVGMCVSPNIAGTRGEPRKESLLLRL